MQFLNWSGEKVKHVSFDFDYKGYNISASNCTPKGRIEVMAFSDNKVKGPFNTVADAIKAIDSLK